VRKETAVTRPLALPAVLAPIALAAPPVRAADPPLIRFGHGFAAEEQVWLMAARPDLTPARSLGERTR